MSLHFDLRVNGKVIGSFEATNTMLSKDPERQWYQCHIRTIVSQATGEVRGSDRQVFHNPSDGPWELVRNALADNPDPFRVSTPDDTRRWEIPGTDLVVACPEADVVTVEMESSATRTHIRNAYDSDVAYELAAALKAAAGVASSRGTDA